MYLFIALQCEMKYQKIQVYIYNSDFIFGKLKFCILDLAAKAKINENDLVA